MMIYTRTHRVSELYGIAGTIWLFEPSLAQSLMFQHVVVYAQAHANG